VKRSTTYGVNAQIGERRESLSGCAWVIEVEFMVEEPRTIDGVAARDLCSKM